MPLRNALIHAALTACVGLPWGTVVLAAAVLGAYLYYSDGLLFLSDDAVDAFALRASDLSYGLFSHLFVHVGARHLLGNLVPLVVFAIIFEVAAGGLEVVSVFLVAGIVSSAVFSLLNPTFALAGASGGVAGLLGASSLIRPARVLPLMVLLPVFVYYVVFPVLDYAIGVQQNQLYAQQQALELRVEELTAAGNARAAEHAARQLSLVVEKQAVVVTGVRRERSAQSDLLVHVVGAGVGVVYVIIRRRDLASKGSREFFASLKRVRNSVGFRLGRGKQ